MSTRESCFIFTGSSAHAGSNWYYQANFKLRIVLTERATYEPSSSDATSFKSSGETGGPSLPFRVPTGELTIPLTGEKKKETFIVTWQRSGRQHRHQHQAHPSSVALVAWEQVQGRLLLSWAFLYLPWLTGRQIPCRCRRHLQTEHWCRHTHHYRRCPRCWRTPPSLAKGIAATPVGSFGLAFFFEPDAAAAIAALVGRTCPRGSVSSRLDLMGHRGAKREPRRSCLHSCQAALVTFAQQTDLVLHALRRRQDG